MRKKENYNSNREGGEATIETTQINLSVLFKGRKEKAEEMLANERGALIAEKRGEDALRLGTEGESR